MKNKTLLLSCCAPCSCAVIEKMAAGTSSAATLCVVFYNPNIRPFEEYVKRREENRKLCGKYGAAFVELEYDPERWAALTKGLEDEPERGKRCDICFKMRLSRVMEYAKANGFEKVGSVLGVSRHKDLEQVNRAAAGATRALGIEYVLIEGRKDGMQERREELIKELGLYEQKYCGCMPRG